MDRCGLILSNLCSGTAFISGILNLLLHQCQDIYKQEERAMVAPLQKQKLEDFQRTMTRALGYGPADFALFMWEGELCSIPSDYTHKRNEGEKEHKVQETSGPKGMQDVRDCDPPGEGDDCQHEKYRGQHHFDVDGQRRLSQVVDPPGDESCDNNNRKKKNTGSEAMKRRRLKGV
jgi:hypothetical protein